NANSNDTSLVNTDANDASVSPPGATTQLGSTYPGLTLTTGSKGSAAFAVATATPSQTLTFTASSAGQPTLTQTATLTSYTPAITSTVLAAAPAKSLYAGQTEYTTSNGTTGTPLVSLCTKDQNGNAFPNANSSNLNVSDSRSVTTGGVTVVTAPAVTVTPDPNNSGCFLLSHLASAGDFGSDTFNAFYNNNGVAGFQAGTSDVAAAPLVLKWATLSITKLDTQAQKGTNVTVGFKVLGADGSPFVGRKVTLTNTRNSTGGFTATQPTGSTAPTFVGNAGTVIATTDANGVASATVSDTVAEQVTVTATDNVPTATAADQIPTGQTATATIDFRPLPVTLVSLTQTGATVTKPGAGAAVAVTSTNVRPGDVATYTYHLADANVPGGTTTAPVLKNTSIALTLDHGFFTPDCTATNATEPYAACTFDPAIADGAPAGNLKSLGATRTMVSNATGDITFNVAIGRDAAFDAAGSILAKLTGVANGGTVTSANVLPFNTAGVTPINGGAIKLVGATAADKLTGDVQDQQSTSSGTGTRFVVHLTDQFGNLITLPASSVTLTTTGLGTLSSATSAGSFLSAPTVITADSNSTSTTGESTTVTGTWQAPVTTFKATTVVAPGPPPTSTTTFATVAGTPVSKTDAFTVNFYKVDLANLAYSFGNTPNQSSYPVNTAVTTSATVKDQKGNPVQGLCVQFLRSGPNDAAGNSQNGGSTGPCGQFTSTAGKAGTTYSSGTPGTATVTVIVTDGSGNELSRGVVNTVFVAGIPQTKIPTISISTTAINVGKSAIVTVHGTPGDSIQLYALTRPATSYQVVRTVTLPASGVYSTAITPRGNTRLFARSAAGDSGTVAVSVRPAMSLAGSVSGKTGTFTGTIVPGHGNVAVRLFTVKNGTITLVGTTRTAANGHYTYSRAFAAKGAVTFIAQTLSDGQNLSTQSNRVTVTF
ncbi:MAG: hypothetical protein QOG99_2047, partial [Frankiales bacterium]|nr:hypothetical protein [Frankiales bacterium]